MKPDDFKRKMDKAVNKALEKMDTRKISLPIFTRLMLSIRKRTRLGFGTNKWGGRRKKLKALSPDYIKQRKRYGFNASKTRASGSNLTRTGKMLDAFRAFFIADGKFALGFTENRTDGKSNEEIAGYHEDGARKFMNPSDKEVKRFKQDIEKNVKKQIIKELKKLK